MRIELGGFGGRAHCVPSAGDVVRGIVDGIAVTALCGVSAVPCRDPDAVPVCLDCVDVLAQAYCEIDEYHHDLRAALRLVSPRLDELED